MMTTITTMTTIMTMTTKTTYSLRSYNATRDCLDKSCRGSYLLLAPPCDHHHYNHDYDFEDGDDRLQYVKMIKIRSNYLLHEKIPPPPLVLIHVVSHVSNLMITLIIIMIIMSPTWSLQRWSWDGGRKVEGGRKNLFGTYWKQTKHRRNHSQKYWPWT